jgi:adenine phosphoribosyltransferase
VTRPADLRALIRDIPDFPKPGIVFKDITPLLLDPHAVDTAVEAIAEWAGPRGVDFVVAAEARGFILGAAIARELGAGFVPARKPGKLPAEVLADGARVLIHDDLLATGGTARALADLVVRLGATVVGCAFLVELAFLDGRRRLDGFDVYALVTYDGE